VSALLVGVLLFLLPYNSGDSSLHEPLGFALWSSWTDTAPDGPDYSYSLLVPLMLAYLLYVKRRAILATPLRPSLYGIFFVLLGLALFWVGSRAGKQYIGCGGIQVLVLGLILWFWGGGVFRQLLFAWAILVFAWPLPFLDTTVAFPMRMIVSHAAHVALNVLGVPTTQSGTALLSAAGPGLDPGAKFQIDVADPCSGLRSLLPLLMFSAFYCYFFLAVTWQRWAVFLSAFVFTIVGNVVRILMLVGGCLVFGESVAIGTNETPSTYHEACGYAVFIVVLGLECGFGLALQRLTGTRAITAPRAPAMSGATASVLPGGLASGRSAAVVGLAALMLIVLAVTPPTYLPTKAGVVMRLPAAVTVPGLGDFYGTTAAVSEVEHRLLPKDTEFSRRVYDDLHQHQIFFSIVLSGVQQYTIHPPEVCLRAQGWTFIGEEDIPVALHSGHQLMVRNLDLQRDALDRAGGHHLVKACYMYWYVADGLATQSHFERNVMSSWDRIMHNRDHRWAYVFAMSPVTQSLNPGGVDTAGTRKLLADFIREIVPTFEKSEMPPLADLSRE
jgi:exosortase